MNHRRLTALTIGLALTAVACGGSSTANEELAAVPSDAPSDPTTEPAPDVPAPTIDGSAQDDATNDIVDASGDGTALSLPLSQATEPWPTDWTKRTVGLDEFQLGIGAVDPRDRIPPIDEPVFEPIASADWLDDREPGALVQFEGETRFYPLSILTRHEIVNDRFGEVPVVITFCPLCNTAISFDARVEGQTLRFGVSGLLRNSDLVMWDDATTSLWQQITGEAVVGDFAGTQLDLIPTSIVSYGDVLENFPDAVSLSRDTGFAIEYGANPYRAYSSSTSPFLFEGDPDPRYPALSRVVGVTLDGNEKAYPFSLLGEQPAINDELAGTPIVLLWGGDTADALDGESVADGDAIGSGIAYDRRVGDQVLTFSVDDGDLFTDDQTGSTWTLLGVAIDGPLEGEQLSTVTHRNEFWFAWAAFFPDAPVAGE